MVEVGRAVWWARVSLGMPGPLEAGCLSLSPHLWPHGWLGRAEELCMVGNDLWLVRIGILAEAGQTFAQVEVSSVWFRDVPELILLLAGLSLQTECVPCEMLSQEPG